MSVTNDRGDATDDDEPVNAGTARLQQGSLRQVILNANAIAGTQTVDFSVGTGQVTINVSGSALPAIDGTLFLDGRTQEGYSGTPLVLIDGNNTVGNGLTLTANADGSTIRGLIIRDFSVYGISIQANSDNNVVYGNYLGGLDFSGNDAGISEGNDGAGLRVDGSGNTIGSATLADRNVISRNAGDGVYVGAGDANVIIGNYIGTNAAGNALAANTDDGVNVYKNGATAATNTRIGGTGAGEGNLISGNLNYGIELAKSGVRRQRLGRRRSRATVSAPTPRAPRPSRTAPPASWSASGTTWRSAARRRTPATRSLSTAGTASRPTRKW